MRAAQCRALREEVGPQVSGEGSALFWRRVGDDLAILGTDTLSCAYFKVSGREVFQNFGWKIDVRCGFLIACALKR